MEIVAKINDVRSLRKDELYRLILNTLLDILSDRDIRVIYSDAVLFPDRYPFGKDGEYCGVWVICQRALFQNAAPNIYLKNINRESILSLMQEKLKTSPFPLTEELFLEAVENMSYPNGIAVDTCIAKFPRCECVSSSTNLPDFHSICSKPAVVVVRHLYTNEEALRRERELEEIRQTFARVEDEIEIWLQILEGISGLKDALEVYRSHWELNLSLNEELMAKDKLKLHRIELKMVLLDQQLQLFREGKPFKKPLFKTEEAANQLETLTG